MIQIALDEWEISGENVSHQPGWSGVADGVFPIPWIEGDCDFAFRVVEVKPGCRFVFARPAHFPEGGNWVVCPAKSDSEAMPDDFAAQCEHVAHHLAAHDGHYILNRFCIFREQGTEKWAILDSSGRGAWTGHYDVTTHFQFEPSADFECNKRAAFECLQGEMADADSDARFAFRWAQLNWVERRALFGGDEKTPEIKAVMEAILNSEIRLWDSAWGCALALHTATYSFDDDGYFDREQNSATYEFCWWFGDEEPYDLGIDIAAMFPLVHRAALAISRVYYSSLKPLGEQHICAQNFDAPFSVGLPTPPSAHQQLEAQLFLNDWLKNHE